VGIESLLVLPVLAFSSILILIAVTLTKGKQTVGNAHAFMCYRRSDSSYTTDRLYDALLTRFGKKRLFRDIDSIPLGVDFVSYVERVMTKCDIVLVVIGRKWLECATPDGAGRLHDTGDPVRIEIETALRLGKPVVPILVDGSTMPREEQLPAELSALSKRNGISIRPEPDFGNDIVRLLEGIRGHLS
jgi:hypothetical protein